MMETQPPQDSGSDAWDATQWHEGRRATTASVLILTVLVMLVAGCATRGESPSTMPLPPARTLRAADTASLAGEWVGTLTGALGGSSFAGRRASVRVTVAPDGSFTSIVDNVPGVGKARIEDGKILFEGSVARGVATLHEGGGRRVLKGTGTWVGYDGRSEFELTPR